MKTPLGASLLALILAAPAFAESPPLHQATVEQWRAAGAVERMDVSSAWAVLLIGEDRLREEGGFVAVETRGFEMLTCLQRALADVDGAAPVTDYASACAVALGWPITVAD